jgi:hypothetical protein
MKDNFTSRKLHNQLRPKWFPPRRLSLFQGEKGSTGKGSEMDSLPHARTLHYDFDSGAGEDAHPWCHPAE